MTNGLSPPKPFQTARERELWDQIIRHASHLTRFDTRPSDFDPELVVELRALAELLMIDYRHVLMSPVN